jgi:hypothetical protein
MILSVRVATAIAAIHRADFLHSERLYSTEVDNEDLDEEVRPDDDPA